MKTFNIFKVAAIAACAFATVSASAKSEASAKVYVNNYHKNNMAVVSVDASKGENSITRMEVTNEAGNVVYASKRIAKLKAAQYLLDIANLQDGAYNVNFSLRNGQAVSKTFVVVDGKVVR